MLYWSYPVSWALTFFAQTAFYFYAAHKLKKKSITTERMIET